MCYTGSSEVSKKITPHSTYMHTCTYLCNKKKITKYIKMVRTHGTNLHIDYTLKQSSCPRQRLIPILIVLYGHE